jgi:hypothetical protein
MYKSCNFSTQMITKFKIECCNIVIHDNLSFKYRIILDLKLNMIYK